MTEPTFDVLGYPTDETLERIATWDPTDTLGLFNFLEAEWHKNGRFYRKDRIVDVATGGWSGNEDLIRAFGNNVTAWSLCWYQNTRGGLYRFEIPQREMGAEE